MSGGGKRYAWPLPRTGAPTPLTTVIVRPFASINQLMPQLYVSSDLLSIRVPAPLAMNWARDVNQGDVDRYRIYRRLDPHWYAFLYRRMAEARLLHKKGAIADPIWQVTRTRFRPVWEFATARWTPAAVSTAITHLPAAYAPPKRAA